MSFSNLAAIFDWDGVVIDSSKQHEAGWERLALEEKRPLPQGFFLRSFGMKNENVIPELLGWTTEAEQIKRLSLRKEQFFRDIVAECDIAPLPGVLPFLKRLNEASIPCVVASSTPRANIECVIDRLALRSYFKSIVAGEDVKNGKPNPEVFLKAGTHSGFPPERCVVFEDAHVGVKAGLAAGMKVVAVATTHPAHTLRDAHRVVARLDELQIADLAKLLT